MKISRKLLAIATAFTISAGASQAYSQTNGTPNAPATQEAQVKEDFSDASLKKFVSISRKLEPHQKKAEEQMVQAIQQQGLTPHRFTQIMAAQQQKDTSNAGANQAELGKFNNAAKKIMVIQNAAIPQMEKVISAEGMQPQEFQQIVLAYNQSPKVRQRIDALIQPQTSPKQ